MSLETPTARTRSGSARDFEAYFAEYWPRLLAFCRTAFGLPNAAAEDVAQEAFLSAYRHWDSIADPGAYTRKVAIRLALKRSPAEEPLVDDLNGRRDECTIEGRQLVREALRQLPGQQRIVFALFLDDYRDADIARIIGLSTATVRSYRRHARRTLEQWHTVSVTGQGARGGSR